MTTRNLKGEKGMHWQSGLSATRLKRRAGHRWFSRCVGRGVALRAAPWGGGDDRELLPGH